jgi:dTDP-4-dehydrorhamnose reductase
MIQIWAATSPRTPERTMKILVIGASGLIGSTVLRVFAEKEELDVVGTVRDGAVRRLFDPEVATRILVGIDVERTDSLHDLFLRVRPEVVVNCVGLTKHKAAADQALWSVPINSLLPHRLSALCSLTQSRLIHISTDCVFSGQRGAYSEDEPPDAIDVYGRSKALGEIVGPNAMTVRTSTIGHELQTAYGLLNWFLAQEGRCKGFTQAVFSGLPTVTFAEILRDVVVAQPDLTGLYHIAAEPISKFDLLTLVAEVYGKSIEIVPADDFVIDRSLDASKFRAATGYEAPGWRELIQQMHAYR